MTLRRYFYIQPFFKSKIFLVRFNYFTQQNNYNSYKQLPLDCFLIYFQIFQTVTVDHKPYLLELVDTNTCIYIT